MFMFKSKKIKFKKNKKIGSGAFKHVQVPMFRDFLKLCPSRLRHLRDAISHIWTSKKPKKIIS